MKYSLFSLAALLNAALFFGETTSLVPGVAFDRFLTVWLENQVRHPIRFR
jgi:hypothetical protein